MVPQLLSLKECIDLVTLVINTPISGLDYYFGKRKHKKIDPIVGEGRWILVIKLTKQNGSR